MADLKNPIKSNAFSVHISWTVLILFLLVLITLWSQHAPSLLKRTNAHAGNLTQVDVNTLGTRNRSPCYKDHASCFWWCWCYIASPNLHFDLNHHFTVCTQYTSLETLHILAAISINQNDLLCASMQHNFFFIMFMLFDCHLPIRIYLV